MDLVTGARRVILAMTHRSPEGSKIVRRCTLPITGTRAVDLIVTELAVIKPDNGKLVLMETADGVSIDAVVAATEAQLEIPGSAAAPQGWACGGEAEAAQLSA